MSDATLLEGDDLRRFAEDELAMHTPANQEGNGYERCALCHFTRHPCDVYDLAAGVLRLLDKIDTIVAAYDRLSLAYINASNPGIDMDEVRRGRLDRPGLEEYKPACPTCGVWHEGHYHHGPVIAKESPISEWHAGDPPGPGQPGDASDAT